MSGVAAGIAYNLGIAHDQINNDGTHNANPDGRGAQDYDFTNTADFDDNAHNLTKFAHYTLLNNDPVTNAG